jgi:sterol desaturase/sphingolipid hydroxylase (fatty acid hydroxylase superfamily)
MQTHLPDPILLAMPLIALIIVVEAIAIKLDKDSEYSTSEAATSIGSGIVALGFSTVLRLAALGIYYWVWENWAPWHVPMNAWWQWLVLFVAVDFLIYVYHCGAHKIRLIWAGHQVHHSSQYLNTAVAFRRKWSQWFEKMIWFPLPLLGFSPYVVFFMHSCHLLYGIVVHTERIGKLPKFVEAVLVTPSHHRVHHGTEPKYIDKNMGSVFILWDRIFGTFQAEEETPKYGLLKQVDTQNLIKLQTYEFVNIFQDVRGATTWRDRFMFTFGRPGWKPKMGERAY